jgi:hypothetical protein
MHAFLSRYSVSFLLLLSSAAVASAAGPSLEATGSGFYGLSEVSGPFGRTNLTPLTTVDSATGGLKVALNANANHIEPLDASHSFQFAVTLAGQGHSAYGVFSGSFSFLLQAKPESATTQFSTIYNQGHSELFSHMKLTFNDSGIVSSSTLLTGTPVTVRFIVVTHGGGSVSEPPGPHNTGDYSAADSSGYLNLLDLNSLVGINGAPFFENQAVAFSLNSAIGHRIDFTAVYTITGVGYAGLDGQTPGAAPFYPTVQGQFDATAHVFVQGPAGVSFVADSGHSYGPNSTVPAVIGNISTRGFVGTGNNVMIGGFIINGSASKKVMLRALGPTLGQSPFNIPGALPDPVLELHAANGTLITSNNNWMSAANASAVSASGYAPPNAVESAILTTLVPGSYTAIVRGAGTSTGVALVECYDLDENSASELGNVSTRGYVDTGNKVMIAGLIVKGPANEHVIVRGLGPTLGQAPFNVPNSLADPFLDLRDANANRVMANNNWADTQAAQIQASGYAPPNAVEAAIDVTLVPGNYTAILSGVNNTVGNGLVDVYALN